MARTAKATATTGEPVPVWQQVEQQQARRLTNRARTASRRRRPLAPVRNLDGPRIRLGIGWFLLVLGALVLGSLAVAVLYGAAAGLAGWQSARVWKKRGPGVPDPVVAAAAAAALPLCATVSTAVLGVGVLGVVAACIVRAIPTRAPLLTASRTLQCCIWAGGAAAAVVLTHRFSAGAALALVLVVSAYEVGDFLIGAESNNVLEGPVAGATAVLVVQFAVSAIGVPPFELPDALLFAVLAAVLCPLGQVAAALILPSTAAPAPALRRIDSLLVLGPVWAYCAGLAATAAS